MTKHMAMACCFASNIQSHLTASHMFAWLSCSCRKLLKFHCQCLPKHWQEICMRLKHQRDEGSSGRQKKARISFEHLDMDKDIYLQVELEVYLCSHHYVKNTGNKARASNRQSTCKQLLFSSSYDIYVLMCSMNATIYDCMQMENSARVDLYTSQSSTLRSTLAE